MGVCVVLRVHVALSARFQCLSAWLAVAVSAVSPRLRVLMPSDNEQGVGSIQRAPAWRICILSAHAIRLQYGKLGKLAVPLPGREQKGPATRLTPAVAVEWSRRGDGQVPSFKP